MIKLGALLMLLSASLFAQPINSVVICDLPLGLIESSGLEQDSDGNFWSHNDSGNEPILYHFTAEGILLNTVRVSNAENVDWEDIALGRAGELFIADIGNNGNQRQNLKIYQINIENLTEGENTLQAGEIIIHYENQDGFPPLNEFLNFDAEALVFRNDSLFIFTKNRTVPFTGITYQYSLPAIPGDYQLSPDGSFSVDGGEAEARVTSADLSADGQLVLLTTTKILLFQTDASRLLLLGDPVVMTIPDFSQKEGICWGNEACTLYMTDEYIASLELGGKLYQAFICGSQSLKLPFEDVIAATVFPNPAQDYVEIHLKKEDTNTENYKVSLISSTGIEVLNTVFTARGVLKINIIDLPAGIYNLIVFNNSEFRRSFPLPILPH